MNVPGGKAFQVMEQQVQGPARVVSHFKELRWSTFLAGTEDTRDQGQGQDVRAEVLIIKIIKGGSDHKES